MNEITEFKPISGAQLRAKSRRVIVNPETGNAYLVRKPTFAQVIATNALPANYLGEMLKRRQKKTEGEEIEAQPDDTEGKDSVILEGDALTRAYVTASLLSPRISADPQSDDECQYEDIPEEDRTFIYHWALGRTSVAVGGEEVDATTVVNFPDGEQGSEPSGAGVDGALRGAEGVAAAGAA